MSKSFLIKTIQYSLLKELSFFELQEFWQEISYTFNNQELNELDIQKLYTDNSDIPVSLFFSILNRSGDISSKYYSILEEHLESFFYPSSPLVNEFTSIAIDVVLETLMNTKGSPVEAFFDMFPSIIHNILKFYDVRLIKKSAKEQAITYMFVSNFYRRDNNYGFFNHNLFISKLAKGFPKMFSENSRVEFNSILEINSYRNFIEKYIPTTVKDLKIYNNKTERVIGEYITINEYLTKSTFVDLNDFTKTKLLNDFGNFKVAVFRKDIYRVINKKEVKLIDKNIAYNSPIFLYAISLQKEKENDIDIKNLFRSLVFYSSPDYLKILSAQPDVHKAYIDFISKQNSYHIEYKNGTVLENGEILAKLIPGKILWYFLKEYKKGKNSFYYKEIIGNRDIFSKYQNPSLSKRLGRLASVVEKNSEIINITLSGSGVCTIHISSDFTLKNWDI